MRLFWWIGLGLFLNFGLACRAQATDYYVSANGNDAQNGTAMGRAWQTLGQINQHTFLPGDRILLHGGDTFAGNLVLRGAGTAYKPITLGAFGRGRPILAANNGTGILIRNAGGWSVKDLIVAGSGRETNTGSGIVFQNAEPGNIRLNYVRITNVEAQGFGKHGILVEGAPADKSQSGYHDVLLSRCATHDNAHTGIYVTGVWDPKATRYANADVTIEHCTAWDNAGDPTYLTNHSGSGIFVEDTDGGLIERCVARNNGTLCPCRAGGPVGIWAAAANNIVIQYCESHHNRTSARSLDGGGFDLDGGVTNSTLQYNYSHDNEGAGYLLYNYEGAPYTFQHNTMRYNISQNDGRKHHYAALHVGGDVRDCDLYNNTVFVSPSADARPCALFLAGGRNLRVCNNLLVTTGGVPLVEGGTSAGIVLRGNDYWSSGAQFQIIWNGKTYPALPAFQAGTGQETKPEQNGGTAVGLNLDPLLTRPGQAPSLDNADKLNALDAYRLRRGSPLINAGVNLPIYYGIRVGSRDFYGDNLPNGHDYDIGAHERK